MKFNKGDKVRVTSNNGVYSTYLKWLCENSKDISKKLSHWTYGRVLNEDEFNDEWTVIYSSKHIDSNAILVFIDNGKESYIIDENCLTKVKKLKWTDLKLGDEITNGDANAIVTEINKVSEFHILAGAYCLNDTDLTHWSKVE